MDHWRVAPGNSDASLSYAEIGNDADDRRASNGRDGYSGNVFRQLSMTPCGPSLHTTYHNRYCPDRSGCRSLPGGDNGHSCRDGQYSPSAAKADENWNKGNNGYIIIQARAWHGWGCGIGGLVRSRPGTAPVSTALSLYLILFSVSLPVAGLPINNGHLQPFRQISRVRLLCADFGNHRHPVVVRHPCCASMKISG